MEYNMGMYFRHPDESGYSTVRRALVANAGVSVLRFASVTGHSTPMAINRWLRQKQEMPWSIMDYSDVIYRQCPICAASLFHTDYYSLPWLIRCPIHKTPFEKKCPDCGKPWPNLRRIKKNHCPTCGCPCIDDISLPALSEIKRIQEYSFYHLGKMITSYKEEGVYGFIFADKRNGIKAAVSPTWSISNFKSKATPTFYKILSRDSREYLHLSYKPLTVKRGPVVKIKETQSPLPCFYRHVYRGQKFKFIEPNRAHIIDDCKNILRIIRWVFNNTDHECCFIGNYRAVYNRLNAHDVCPICCALSVLVNSLSDQRLLVGPDINYFSFIEKSGFPEILHRFPYVTHNKNTYRLGYKLARYFKSLSVEQVFTELISFLRQMKKDSLEAATSKNVRLPTHIPERIGFQSQGVHVRIHDDILTVYLEDKSPLDLIRTASLSSLSRKCMAYHSESESPHPIIPHDSITIRKGREPDADEFSDWYLHQFYSYWNKIVYVKYGTYKREKRPEKILAKGEKKWN